MDQLEGRVAVVTGSGAGIGRETALHLAAHGVKVVVNDLASGPDGPAAERVVEEIRAAGGEALANTDSVTEPDGVARLLATATEGFGSLEILVNNAGILRDRMLHNMSLAEWDAIMAVHLRGAFLTTQRAAGYWRDRHKAGDGVPASVVNMTSGSGLHSSPGQANYAAAKSGIATFTQVLAKEGARYGLRANAVAPTARTQLTSSTDQLVEIMKPPADPDAFDAWHPRNVAPVVAYLASPACTLTGQVLGVFGDKVGVYQPWTVHHMLDNKQQTWDFAALDAAFGGAEPLPEVRGMM
jgi:NAD(P)-dependent dehydrogenase (short-subunit alcohol dehydrogenase family)